MIKISPSILSADLSNLEKEINKLEKSGADMIHIDVMDGHFVPNLTFGAPVIKSLRKCTNMVFDVHLMINNPEQYITNYADAGADIITIHPESTRHLDRTLNQIKKTGKKAGVALLPTSSINTLEYVKDIIDLVLVMTVNPGFSGQKFIQNQIEKIKNIKEIIRDDNIILAIDGGINDQSAKLAIDAGADMLISGNFIFTGDYKTQINKLKNIQ